MTLTRLPDWRARYDAAIAEIKAAPFDWATNECATGLAARIVEAVTGVDLASRYAGSYHDAASAARHLKRLGFDDLADLAASVLPEIHPSRAVIGDIAAIPVEGPIGHALGVVNGERIYVLMDFGWGTVDLTDATRAFKVG